MIWGYPYFWKHPYGSFEGFPDLIVHEVWVGNIMTPSFRLFFFQRTRMVIGRPNKKTATSCDICGRNMFVRDLYRCVLLPLFRLVRLRCCDSQVSGTFNPPHRGHVRLGLFAKERLEKLGHEVQVPSPWGDLLRKCGFNRWIVVVGFRSGFVPLPNKKRGGGVMLMLTQSSRPSVKKIVSFFL